jgi:hypothetical protein
MTRKDHDTTVIHTGNDSNGSAAWFVAGAALVVALIGGYFFVDGNTGGSSVNVDVNAPAVEAPAGGAGEPAIAPAGDASAGGDAAVDGN